MDLSDCIPKHNSDTAAVERAAALGYPTIIPILPDLLEWLQDANWPVARTVAPLLAKAGPEIAPHLRAILNSDDDVWKYWVVTILGPHLSGDAWREVKPEITRLSQAPTAAEKAEEIDLEAHRLLALRSNPES